MTSRTKSGALSLLAEAPFRNFFIGRSISAFGNRLSPLAIAFGVLGAGGSAGDLGLVIGASTVPQLLLMLFGGVAGDRFERRRILITSDLVMGVAQAVTAWVFLTGRVAILPLICLQFVIGAAEAFFSPASTGALRDFVGPSRVQQAQSLLSISRSSLGIAGPAVAGFIIAVSNAGTALAIDSLTFFVSALALARVKLPHTKMEINSTIRRDLADGWREFAGRSWVWAYVSCACIFQATVWPAIGVIGPKLAVSQLGGASAWALVMSMVSVGTVLSGVIMLRWRPRYPMRSATWLLFLALPMLLLLAAPSLQVSWLLLPAAAIGAAIPMADTLWLAALADHIPAEAQSRVSSYDWLGSLAMAPIGYAVIGHVAEANGLSHTMLGVAAVVTVATLLTLSVPQIRQLPRG